MFHSCLAFCCSQHLAFSLIIFILQLGSLSSGNASTGSPWLPPSSINFQSFNENADLASSERGFLGSAPTFVPGFSNATNAAGGAGTAARTGRGAKVGTGAFWTGLCIRTLMAVPRVSRLLLLLHELLPPLFLPFLLLPLE